MGAEKKTTDSKLPKVDRDFQNLIPPLTTDEFSQLEANCIADGKINDPIILWDGMVLDGHNRLKIAVKHGLTFSTQPIDLPDRNSAVLWIVNHQLGRRNLSDIDRIALARTYKTAVSDKARQRMETGSAEKLEDFDKSNCLKSDEGLRTDAKLAKVAGVGRAKFRDGEKVLDKGTPALVKATREKRLSVHAAAAAADLPAKEQNAIADGKKTVKEAKADVESKADAVLDALGNAVPESLAKVWANLTDFDRLLSSVRSLKKIIGDIIPKSGSGTDYDGLHFLVPVEKEIRNAVRLIENYVVDARPRIVCVYCRGKGCATCHKVGWIPAQLADSYLKTAVHEKRISQETADAAA